MNLAKWVAYIRYWDKILNWTPEFLMNKLPHDIDSSAASSLSRLYLAIPAFCVNVRKTSSKSPERVRVMDMKSLN